MVFPNDKEFLPTDYNSQLMFDFEGLEERKLWCLGQNDLLKQVEEKIRKLVKVNELYNLVDLQFDMDQDLNKMKDSMVKNWKQNKKNSPKQLKSSLYSVSNLITCSFVSNNVAQTKYIFESLVQPNEDFRV